MFRYPILLHHIFVSPGHNYFGQDKAVGPSATHPTHDLVQVEAHAGKGLVGDRFYAVRDDFDGQATFVAHEVINLLRAELGKPELEQPALQAIALRRNIVIEGADLNGLIGQDFEIAYPEHNSTRDNSSVDEQRIQFRGTKHCSPCRWMDLGVASGALKLLKGRGGLRTQILTDGLLRTGPAILYTDVKLDPTAITSPRPKPRLP